MTRPEEFPYHPGCGGYWADGECRGCGARHLPIKDGNCATPGCQFMGYGDDNLCDVCYSKQAPEPPKEKRTSGAYAKVPIEILSDPFARRGHLRVFAQLSAHANLARKAWPRQQTLADELGMSRATVARFLSDLEQGSYIARVDSPRKMGGRSRMWLVPDGTTVAVPLGARINPDNRRRKSAPSVATVATDRPLHAVATVDTPGVARVATADAHGAARNDALTVQEAVLQTFVRTHGASAPNSAPPPPEVQERFDRLKGRVNPNGVDEEEVAEALSTLDEEVPVDDRA